VFLIVLILFLFLLFLLYCLFKYKEVCVVPLNETSSCITCVYFVAVKVAVKTLPFYKNYFNIAYPLPKMDLIAIADFAAGKVTTILHL